jgi:hypothetical protein
VCCKCCTAAAVVDKESHEISLGSHSKAETKTNHLKPTSIQIEILAMAPSVVPEKLFHKTSAADSI